MGFLSKIARSTKLGGLSGLAASLLILLAQQVGLELTPEQAALLITVVTTVIFHFTPDTTKQQVDALAKRVDISARELAAKVPEIEATYPNDIKTETKDRNFNKGK